jgi:2-polyprenyl-3-methyl-5-hydroxy-6-metoxy-1,4-benzoquinol methylase
MIVAATDILDYERIMNGLQSPYMYGDELRLDLLRLIPVDGKTIGSIGCGTGITELELVKQGREVHGVDSSEFAIEIAKPRLTSARVVRPDEIRVFSHGSLDGLILADVLEHMPSAWDRLAEYARMVKPGGWVVISTPNMRHWTAILRFFVLGDWPERNWGIFDKTHVQMMSKRRLRRWCLRAGLEIERWYDRYDPDVRNYRISRTLDLLTFRLLHGLFQFQLQCVCRTERRAKIN